MCFIYYPLSHIASKYFLGRLTRFRNLFYRSLLVFVSFGSLAAQPAATNSAPVTKETPMKDGIEVEDFVRRHTPRSGPKELNNIQLKNFTIKVESKGGVISSFKHKNPNNPLKNNVELVADSAFRFEAYKTPASLRLLNQVSYTLETPAQKEGSHFRDILAKVNVMAKTKRGNYPLTLTKRYRFYNDLHYWEYSWEIENRSGVDLRIPELFFIASRPIGPEADQDSPRAEVSFYNFYYSNESLETVSTHGSGMGCGDSSVEDGYVDGEVDFFGTSSRFMIMTIQPQHRISGLYIFKKSRELHVQLDPVFLEARKKTSLRFLVYTGPKAKDFVKIRPEWKSKHSLLAGIHPKIYEAFNFGITGPIRDLIVLILDVFYALIPNYGWGIIIFSILFKLVFFPLNQKQADSMKKMAGIQPLLKEINEKYKSNPQEKQRRTMALYKEHKINPLSSCLPMLIQIPIFFALYAAFSDSYDLWRSPFIDRWIDDLSEPDTVHQFASDLPIIGGMNLNILPLIMGGTQVLQSKFTVMTGDASQQKIMQFLPILLIFFFWNLPSGVVLYWTIQNILSIAQQLYTNSKKDKEVKT